VRLSKLGFGHLFEERMFTGMMAHPSILAKLYSSRLSYASQAFGPLEDPEGRLFDVINRSVSGH
jgi:hypothetical protein